MKGSVELAATRGIAEVITLEAGTVVLGVRGPEPWLVGIVMPEVAAFCERCRVAVGFPAPPMKEGIAGGKDLLFVPGTRGYALWLTATVVTPFFKAHSKCVSAELNPLEELLDDQCGDVEVPDLQLRDQRTAASAAEEDDRASDVQQPLV